MELPTPEPGPGEVLVHLSAAGLNPVDALIAEGMFDGAMPHTFPLVLGVDGAGTVEAIGEGVTHFAVGDRVFGRLIHPPIGQGTYAEYTAGPEDQLAMVPDAVTDAQAAALPMAGMTALGMVDELGRGDLTGRTVLIVGATGGVGSFATQLAAGRGAKVIVTAKPDAAPRMREFGASEIIDHTLGPVAEQVEAAHPEGVYALIDLVSDGPGFAELAELVQDGGVAQSTMGAADVDTLASRGITGGNFQSVGGQESLDRLAAAVREGSLQVSIDEEVPLADAPAALARNRASGARGKTVILI
ncbi:MAG: alcohol dehydrogenase GroES protein [Actinomycetia bacterium]|nr:alcohol dehydrogenase GroES protein [Actinomycetes bacterium]